MFFIPIIIPGDAPDLLPKDGEDFMIAACCLLAMLASTLVFVVMSWRLLDLRGFPYDFILGMQLFNAVVYLGLTLAFMHIAYSLCTCRKGSLKK